MSNSCDPISNVTPSEGHVPFSLPAVSLLPSRPSLSTVKRPRRVSTILAVAVLAASVCSRVHGESAAGQPAITASAPAPYADFVAEAAQRFDIPAAWIRAVMRAESFDDAHATSPKGAIGLMQIMPETWATLRQRYGLGVDPYDAHDNIMAGAAYLRELRDSYGIPGFLAAYNAGPARWEDHVSTGRPLPEETRAYLVRLLPVVDNSAADDSTILAAVVRSWTEASLFPARRTAPSNDGSSAVKGQQSRSSNDGTAEDWTGLAPRSDGLFVVLSKRKEPR